ncbi:unnamed protein product [Rotaria magnacalcarata]|uniref:Telomere-associated protein Rif1 N-terminal domain-containing protein n=1 Tax=Rotaria magnacalcarata TaxID=392030 RepID=A0A819RNA8_9BILA|nr:unnamed protein product [Rotaria magnacalcarata]CAF4046740.1 unnamed protein product [Rotaria magnacalcarata]
MSTSSMIELRKTRSTTTTATPHLVNGITDESNILHGLRSNLHCSIEFINIYNQCYHLASLRSSLFEILCNILSNSVDVDAKILKHILESLLTNHDSLLVELTGLQFKQDILPFIKRILSATEEDDNDVLLLSLKFLIKLIDNYSTLLSSTLAEWLASILHFVVTRITSSSYVIFGDLIIDLLTKIVKNFTPLPKEIVDVLGRSPSSIISTQFLSELKSWVKHVDDIRLALFAIHLWEPLAALLSRLLTRGHTKGNEMLAVMQDAFVVANYSIRGAAFSSWSSFMSHIYRSDLNLHNDDVHQQQLYNRLLKLFLTPFLPDYTSKSKSASIAKCHAWLILVSTYPKHIDDVLLPFLSFAFGYHISSKIVSTPTTWWPECRKMGAQCLHDILTDNATGESVVIKTAGDQILHYLFDIIEDELLEYTGNEEKSLGLLCWHAYLNHLTRIFTTSNNSTGNNQREQIDTCILTHIFTTNNSMDDNRREQINTGLLTRIEQLWIDSRISTRFLLKLFDTFEQTSFPLAMETVLRESSIRTKTLSATQDNPLENKSSSNRTSLSDQYLQMMLEHTVRFTNVDDDQKIEETYLHILSYLIDTLSKTSDDNFCHQTCSLLQKCSIELPLQPLNIPTLFWHIWLRCSTHLISILNRTRSMELDTQRQETTIELLIRPFEFGDSHRLDYSYTLLWTQLFKAICRVALLDGKQLIEIYVELSRHTSVFLQSINNQQCQRLFGFLLTIVKSLLKYFNDIDLSTIPKRSLSSIIQCYTQMSIIINSILQRLLSHDENSSQWLSVCCCLLKSTRISSNEQLKSIVLTYARDVVVDLFSLCKTCSQFETILTNLTELQSFLTAYEQVSSTTTTTLGSSPLSINKQPQSDNVLFNRIISTLNTVFESTNSSTLLQLIYPILIIAFQHSKAIVRNKTRKCWNETFGRLSFIVYPNELRACLRDLKDKEHLLLPCFLADHDNSHTASSEILPNSTDESQFSQQVDIVTPLINPPRPSSSERIHSPCLQPIHSTNTDQTEPIFVPITNNINHDSQSQSPVVISKRMASTSTCLTEKQKEKLRTRHAMPLLCDDTSNAQSSSCTFDTPTIESMMATYQLRNSTNGNKQTTNIHSTSLFNQSSSNSSPSVESPSQDNNTTVESASSPTIMESENSSTQLSTDNNDDDIPEESLIVKKLRRSRRQSTSARKSLTNRTKLKAMNSTSNELLTTIPSVGNSPTISSNIEIITTRPIKSILKRLSPTKPRQDHIRHVAFHDQVRVLLFASPARRDVNAQQQKKKSPNKDELKNLSTIATRRSSLMNNNEQVFQNNNKTRSSKLFNFADDSKPEASVKVNKIEELPRPKPAEPIYPTLLDCDKPLDSLIHVVYGGVCPTNAINYFRSIKLNTVGDIARSTAAQIEVYPLPPPKLANILKALSLYQERLINSPSLSPIVGTNGEPLTPIASTSEEPIAISDGTFTKEASSLPTVVPTLIEDPHNSLYDVDTLIDSLDYEQLYLTNHNNDIDDEIEPPAVPPPPPSTSRVDFIQRRRRIALVNRDEEISPQKRRLSIANKDEEENLDSQELDEQISPKKQTICHRTLGERLQKAADLFKENGHLQFDEDYIELVRQLFNNSSLTHLERLHLKSLFLDN